MILIKCITHCTKFNTIKVVTKLTVKQAPLSHCQLHVPKAMPKKRLIKRLLEQSNHYRASDLLRSLQPATSLLIRQTNNIMFLLRNQVTPTVLFRTTEWISLGHSYSCAFTLSSFDMTPEFKPCAVCFVLRIVQLKQSLVCYSAENWNCILQSSKLTQGT